jgi:transketolase
MCSTVAPHPRSLSQDDLQALAQLLRVDSIRASTSAGSGHATSSMSAADLLAVLVAQHLNYEGKSEGPNERPSDLL